MFREGISILLFLLITITVNAQKTGIEYITAIDTLEPNHHLIFKKDGTFTLVYHIRRGVNWNIEKPKTFAYKKVNDTLHISLINESGFATLNTVEKRILNSKFVVESKSQLRDPKSGYIYVSQKCVRKFKNGIIVLENEIYIIKNKKMRGLHRKLKQINIDNYKTKLIRGKRALDKYGFIGMYGVIEITEK